MLWSLKPADACAKHGLLLAESVCGAPSEEWIFQGDRAYSPGVCRRCGSIGFRCIVVKTRKASATQLWIAREVGRVIEAVTEAELFDTEKMRGAIVSIVKDQWPDKSSAARSLNVSLPTLLDSLTGRTATSLRLVISLCSATDRSIIGLLRGEASITRSSIEPLAYSPYFENRRTSKHFFDLRAAANKIILEQPDVEIGRLAQQLKVQYNYLSRGIPDVVERFRNERKRRAEGARWRRLIGFARWLRAAKQQLNEAALLFNDLSVFKLTGLMTRSEDEERLYRFVRGSP